MVFDSLAQLLDYACRDRYMTADTRRLYKPGEVSEKTGLQKKEDGSWGPVENGYNKKQNEEGPSFEEKKFKHGIGYVVSNTKKNDLKIYPTPAAGGGLIYVATYKSNTGKIKDLPGRYSTLEGAKQGVIKQITSSKKTPSKSKLTAETKIVVKKESEHKPQFVERLLQNESPTVVNGFENYKGVVAIESKIRKAQMNDKIHITESEDDALNTWLEPLNGDPYLSIQRYCRDPRNYTNKDKYGDVLNSRLTKDKAEKTVKGLDSLFSKIKPIGVNVTTYHGAVESNYSLFRNVWGIKGNKDEVLMQLKEHIGESFKNVQYLSTSLNEKGAAGWHNSEIEIKVNIPRDKRAILCNDFQDVDPDDTAENELLINRGARFKLDEAKMGRNRAGKKAVLVTLTLIDDGVKL